MSGRHRAWEDGERVDYVLERVESSGDGWWSLSFDGGMCCGMEKTDLVTPKVGDRFTLWGKGFGFSFRGQAINGIVVWYRSEAEDREHRRAEHDKREAEQKAEYEAKRAEYDAQIAELPEPFRERIQGYLARNPDFGWKFLPYELMCCEQAVLIASACGTPDGVHSFHALPWEEQKRAVPGLDDGHSGNSFGFSCLMARIYLEQPELIPKAHGALAVLVGSEEYGDWSSTQEAALEREKTARA
jgi:hypothetical protein